MLVNYYKIAVRHLRSIYSLINLSGLTIGLTVFILIFLWVNDELSYDRFHTGYERVFRVVEHQQDNGRTLPIAVTPPLLGDYLKNSFGEVENTCRLIHFEALLRYDEIAFYQKGLAVDTSFFSIFSFPLVDGNINSFREGVDKIIINEKLAAKYFGKTNAMGKIFKMVGRDLMVVGVMKNGPGNSHLQFDYVMPVELIKTLGWNMLDRWDEDAFHTYVKLKATASKQSFEPKIKNIVKNNDKTSTVELFLQPLADIHLRSKHLSFDMPGHEDIQYVYIFISAAIFVLLIACINYTNLAMARSMRRAKEAGVRKVAGASRLQLMLQYYSESLIYCMLAFGLALLISWLLLPLFNDLSGRTLSLAMMTPRIFLTLGAVLLACVFMAGAYPALFLSSLKPVVVFNGLLKARKSSIFFRRTFVIIQFTLSVALVVATLVVHHQLQFIRLKGVGYDKENVLTFHIIRKVINQYPSIKEELKALPGVMNVTATSLNLSYIDQSTSYVNWEGKDPQKNMLFAKLMTDHDFVKTFSIPMAEGRPFSESIASDSSAFLLNEAAVRQMGISNVVGSTITVDKIKGTVVGVVKDFNFKSVHVKVEPMIIHIDPKYFNEIVVKLNKENIHENIKSIEKVYKKFIPDRPFDYTFLDEDIGKLYKSEEQTGKIFDYLAILSIFISCLGLLGIVTFTTEQRSKEMAVRKVMGASSGRIFLILSKESVLLVVASNLIGLPIALYFMNRWLEKFAYFENAPGYLMVGAALFSVIIAWLVIGFFCLKAANTNPVDSLRSE